MVKSEKNFRDRLENREKLSKFLDLQIRSLIRNLTIRNMPELINSLIIYQKLKKACGSVDCAYSILLVCLIFQEHNNDLQQRLKLCSAIKSSLAKLHTLHSKKQLLKSSHKLFQEIQILLNESSEILEPSTGQLKSSLKILYCSQLLKVISSVSFKISMRAFLRILNNETNISIFSFFTNKSLPVLPASDNEKIVLVLDLDETLGYFNGKHFLVRPGAPEFIQKMSEKYELVLFTSALEQYANMALEKVDLKHKIVFRLYRQHLLRDSEGVVKDLRILGRKMNRVIIVDNDSRLFRNQPSNGFNIKSWTGDLEDRELEVLGDALYSCDKTENSLELLNKLRSAI